MTSDSLRNESQPQARGNGKELLKNPCSLKQTFCNFVPLASPQSSSLFHCPVEHQHTHTQRYPHRQAFYLRFTTEATFPFYCGSIPDVTVYSMPGVLKLKVLKRAILSCTRATRWFLDAST